MKHWIDTAANRPLTSPEPVELFRSILVNWQAVRAKTKGRKMIPVRGRLNRRTLCIDDLLQEAMPFVEELGDLTLRDIPQISARQRRALTFLWEIFRALPTIGTANAVGVTKAVKLVTLGRIGPALDREVRRELRIPEPRSAEEWVATLHAIAEDLARFETATGAVLEDLVEAQYRPVGIGRAYDMAAGPRNK